MFKLFAILLVIAFTAFVPARAALELPPPLLDGVLPLPVQVLTPVQWEASASPSVAGYAVYCLYSVVDIPLAIRIDAGPALAAVLPLTIGTEYTIYVVAYDSEGVEGVPSDSIIHTPAQLGGLKLNKQPNGPAHLQFRTSPLAVCRIEYTSQLETPNWKFLMLTTADFKGNAAVYDFSAAGEDSRFYRIIRL